MGDQRDVERFEAIVIGGGQAGLAAGYHLRRHGIQFRDPRRRRPRRRRVAAALGQPPRCSPRPATTGCPGCRSPATGITFPTKDEVADYLEGLCAAVRPAGAERCPRRPRAARGWRAPRFPRHGGGPGVRGRPGRRRDAAPSTNRNVPAIAKDLDPAILQLHSSEYRRPAQLRDGPVLVVGAANSGAEIALDIARRRRPADVAGRARHRPPAVRHRGPRRPVARSR